MIVALICYSILLMGATGLAGRAVLLAQSYAVSREIGGRTSDHHCDDPATCPADFVIAEMQANVARARNELIAVLLVLLVTLVGIAAIFTDLAAR